MPTGRQKTAGRRKSSGGGGSGETGKDGAGGSRGGNGGGLSPKKQHVNKQSAKQRIRAEAAERSRLSRKAHQAITRASERQEAAATVAASVNSHHNPSAPPPPNNNTPEGSHSSSPTSTKEERSARKSEQRKAVLETVETKLRVWRRKCARTEAGLPEEPDHDHHLGKANGYFPEQTPNHGYIIGENNEDGGTTRTHSALANMEPVVSAAVRASADTSTRAGSCSGNGGTRAGGPGGWRFVPWPEVFNGPVRQRMPGYGFSNRCQGERNGRDPSGRGLDGEVGQAPWMEGLADRAVAGSHGVPEEGGVGQLAGDGAGDGDACVATGKAQLIDAMSMSNYSDEREGRRRDSMHEVGDGTTLQDALTVPRQIISSSRGGGGMEGRGGAALERKGKRAGYEDVSLSDLHYELIKFEEYVSLTPAEVSAREVLVSSIGAAAAHALGHGAAARSFGSYSAHCESCFSIFLSDVDISVRPPPAPLSESASPCNGVSLGKPRPADKESDDRSSAALAADGDETELLDLTHESDGEFEHFSTSSSVSTSSSTSSSGSDACSNTDLGGDEGDKGPYAAADAAHRAAAKAAGNDALEARPGRHRISSPSATSSSSLSILGVTASRVLDAGRTKKKRKELRHPIPAESPASGATEAIYVPSSGSEDHEGGSEEGGQRSTGTVGASSRGPKVSPENVGGPSEGEKRSVRIKSDEVDSGKNMRDIGPEGGKTPRIASVTNANSGTSIAPEVLKTGEHEAGNDTCTALAGGLGFVVDCRPDPALQRIAAEVKQEIGNRECSGKRKRHGELRDREETKTETDEHETSTEHLGFVVDHRPDPTLKRLATANRTEAEGVKVVNNEDKAKDLEEEEKRIERELSTISLGFVVDRRPDPELQLLATQEKITVAVTVAEKRDTSMNGDVEGEVHRDHHRGESSNGSYGERPPSDDIDKVELPRSSFPVRQQSSSPAATSLPRRISSYSEVAASPVSGKSRQRKITSPTAVDTEPSPLLTTAKGKKRPLPGAHEARIRAVSDENGGEGRLRAVFSADGGGWSFVRSCASESDGCGKGNPAGGRRGVSDEDVNVPGVGDRKGRRRKGVDCSSGMRRGEERDSLSSDGGSSSGGDSSSSSDSNSSEDSSGEREEHQQDRETKSGEASEEERKEEREEEMIQEDKDAAVLANMAAQLAAQLRAQAVATEKSRSIGRSCSGGSSSGVGERKVEGTRSLKKLKKNPGRDHAAELVSLVREQERRSCGTTLPTIFTQSLGGEPAGLPRRPDEASRAKKLQAALEAAAQAAAKRQMSIPAPPDSQLQIHVRPAHGVGREGAWRGGKTGGKGRAVSGLRKLGRRLMKIAWVKSFEFRSRAKVPIIAMLDARSGVECDVGWAGDGMKGDCWDDPADAPGPAFFAKMFPRTFRPLAKFLKVLMHQRGLDKPFTGGIGSFKLYALIASHLEACGSSALASATNQADLGDLLLSFLHRYSPDSREGLTQNTVLRVKGLTVDLGSAFRAVAASKVFRRAYQFLSTGSTARSSGSKGGDYDGNRIREAISDYPDDDGKNDFVPKRSLRQQQQSIRAKPRKSILGRVIWEEDLQRERESRLVACGCSKTSPRPSGTRPYRHYYRNGTPLPGGVPRHNQSDSSSHSGGGKAWVKDSARDKDGVQSTSGTTIEHGDSSREGHLNGAIAVISEGDRDRPRKKRTDGTREGRPTTKAQRKRAKLKRDEASRKVAGSDRSGSGSETFRRTGIGARKKAGSKGKREGGSVEGTSTSTNGRKGSVEREIRARKKARTARRKQHTDGDGGGHGRNGT